jgi:peptide deformylase
MSEMITFNTDEAVKDTPQLRQETVYELVPENHPILKQVMPLWDFKNPPMNPIEIASNLVDTCRKHKGYGLSANQCGLPYRLFVMGYDKEYMAFFNPRIISTEEDCHMIEGCLSFPFLGLYITRPKKITVEFENYNGKTETATYDGISARCFQHELDHMNGIVYTSKVKPMALQSGMQKRNKILKKLKLK